MNPNATRIYTVVNRTTGEKTLVEATHPANAVKVVVGFNYDVSVTPSAELVKMIQAGTRLLRQEPPATTALKSA